MDNINHKFSSKNNIGLSTKDAAIYLGVSAQWLKQARCNGKSMVDNSKRIAGPTFYKIGSRKIVYKKYDIDEWLSQYRQE